MKFHQEVTANINSYVRWWHVSMTGPTGSLHIQQLAATLPKLVILTSTDIIL